jgi:hypothetical protein
MALTLVEAAKYSNTVLQAGVIELIVKDDPIFERLPFMDILGNSLTYNVETTEADAQFYDVGDTWVEGTHVVTASTATLKIMGGDADVDNFLLKTRSNINDLKQETINAKSKAVKKKFMDTFWYGNTTLDAKSFNGMHTLVASGTYNTHAIGTASTTEKLLLMTELEEAIDMVKVNPPELIVMTKLMRRYINKYLHGVGGITYDDAANARVQTLFGIPVAVSDYLVNTENVLHAYVSTTDYGYDVDVATTDVATSIFILSFGPQACQGLQTGIPDIEVFDKLETKNASRYRIVWYPSLMLQNILTCVKVTGVDPDGTVAA